MATNAEGPGLVVHGGGLDVVVEVSRRAEAAGFGSVWTTEFYDRSASISLAAMAQATERVTLGSAIMYAVGRSPLVLAVEARDLNQLSGGRLVLGLGTGTRRMQADWHGIDPSAPAVRMEELVPLLRRIWSLGADGVEHDGRFYRLQLVPTGNPGAGDEVDIPIYMGGVNARMIRAAGHVADGLVGHPLFTPRYVADVVRPALAEAADEVGRDKPPSVAGYVICAVHDDVETARREAKAQIAFYSLVRSYEAIMALHGFQAPAAAARAAWAQRDREGMIEAVTDEMVDTIAVAGSPDEVRQRLDASFGGIYDRVLLYSPSYGLSTGRLRENLDAIIDAFGQGMRA